MDYLYKCRHCGREFTRSVVADPYDTPFSIASDSVSEVARLYAVHQCVTVGDNVGIGDLIGVER